MDADEFWDTCHQPKNKHRLLDLSDGRVAEWPRRTRWQAVVTTRIAFELSSYATRTGTGYVASSCAITLGADRRTVRGMCAGYFIDVDHLKPEDRWDGTPPRVAVLTGSMAEERTIIEGTALDFLRHGTRLVWVIDPDERTVTALAGESRAVVFAVGDALTADVLSGFSYRVADLYRQPGERRVSA